MGNKFSGVESKPDASSVETNVKMENNQESENLTSRLDNDKPNDSARYGDEANVKRDHNQGDGSPSDEKLSNETSAQVQECNGSDTVVSHKQDSGRTEHSDQAKSTDERCERQSREMKQNTDEGSKEKLDSKEEQSMNEMIQGSCTFDSLPPLPKKVVRIFISSTFTDTKEERNAFMENVYPKLSDYCRAKYGLDFQVVDMRWGVPEQASDNHSTTDLCLQEIKKCKEVSFGPNFVAIVGDKYGYRPIPSTITESLFATLENFAEASEADQGRWATVKEWYLKDDNCIPPVYVLQPISHKISDYNNTENDELKKAAWTRWNDINGILTSCLREAATKAFESSEISKAEWELFYISVTENEINQGLSANKEKAKHECCSIIRKIEDIHTHLTEVKTPRYVDVTTSKDIDAEAQKLLTQLKESKIEKSVPSPNLIKVDIEWCISGANVAIEKVKETDDIAKVGTNIHARHNKYVDELCSSFFQNVKCMIDEAGEFHKNNENFLVTEVAQHWHLAKKRCDVFEGREDLLLSVENYLKDKSSNIPCIVYGCSGSGKTAVMSKILERLSKGTTGIKNSIIIPRFLGTTPLTSNVHQLLVSICTQLSSALSIEWNEPEKFQDLIHSFSKMMKSVPSDKSVVLLLDSIDQLMPAYGAFKLKWIPEQLPSNVKVIVSCIKEGYPILNAFTSRFGNKFCLEVLTLSQKTGLDIIQKWLLKDNKKITTLQMDMVVQALNKCSLPLYLRIVYDEIRKWRSYEEPSHDQLQTTVQGALDKLLQSLEEKFGLLIVKHALAYLTVARHGLAESELEHILSLDDVLLNYVFRLWNPPVRRIPPLLWTRLRTEIQSYIVERSADDTLIIAWYHRQFIEAVKTKYLKDSGFAMHIQEHLAEYFSGVWGGGKEKPFKYTEAQAKRFSLTSTESAKDRKVPMQPYVFTEFSTRGNSVIRYNQRKISELPFHLTKTKNYRDLKSLTFCNFEWLFAKMKSQSVLQVLEEFDLFMQADKQLKEDKDMQLLLANLSLIRPFIQKYPDSLAYELTGRLAKYTGQSNALTELIRGCDKSTLRCPLTPLFTCFQTADVGFKQNIKFRDTEPWVKGGAITCSPDAKALYILDYHDENQPVLLIYDVNTGDQTGFISITKPEKDAIDKYCSIRLSEDGEKVYACCTQVPETVARKNAEKFGIVYIIDIASGIVAKTIEEFLHSKNFADPVRYSRQDILCIDFCAKVSLVNMNSGDQKAFSKPPLLHENGELIIACDKDKTVLRKLGDKQEIAQFDSVESQMGVFGTPDFGLVILIASGGKHMRFYDASSKCAHLDKTSFIKAKKAIDMTDAKQLASLEVILDTHGKEEKERGFIDNHVDVKIAPDKNSFMVIFSGQKWVAFLYSLNILTWSVKYVGHVTKEEMGLEHHYPNYSCDSQIIRTKGKTVSVLSSKTLTVVQEFQMSSDIRSLHVLPQLPKVLVMLKKNVLILNTDQKPDENKSKQSHDGSLQKTQSVIFQRTVSNNCVQNELLLKHVDGSLKLEAIEDLVRYIDTDRISTARSKRATALMKFITPNGLRAIHYHAKVQVIDTQMDRVEYTPKKGDVLLRVVNVSSSPSTETIKISGLEPGNRSVEMALQNGDRIVNEYNKVKYRVNKCDPDQYKIINVPSQLSIYTVEDMKLKRLQTLSVYQESVLTVSNKLIVTSKESKMANFINIYDQDTGKLTASHEQIAPASIAQFSTDKGQLFVADVFLNLSIYEAPEFTALEQRVNLQENKGEKYKVTQIHTFDEKRSCALVAYSQDISAKHLYRFVDVTSKMMSDVIEVKLPLEDISEDGKYAVDSKLNFYNLITGKVKLHIMHDSETANICAKISSDNRHVVYVDRNDDSLHVNEVTDGGVLETFACFCHAADILKHGLILLSKGRIILINTKRGMNPLVFDGQFGMKDATDALTYTNEWSRSLSILKRWSDEDSDAFKKGSSHYEKRELIRRQLDDEISRENRPEETGFSRDNVAKPQVLIICEPVLSTHLRPGQFSQYLITEVEAVENAKDASEKLEKLTKKYDAILLQLITDDVSTSDADTVLEKVDNVVERSKQLTKITLISLAPPRIDNQDLNRKIVAVNAAISQKYSKTHGVYICRNENLSDNGKPLSKYFHGGVILSEVGVKQLLVNFKDIILPPIAQNAPDIQTSGNKQLFMFWSKFM